MDRIFVFGQNNRMQIHKAWLDRFWVSPEVVRVEKKVMKFMMRQATVAPRHSRYMKSFTKKLGRGNVGIIEWNEKNVYFKERHYGYLSTMVSRRMGNV